MLYLNPKRNNRPIKEFGVRRERGLRATARLARAVEHSVSSRQLLTTLGHK